MKYNKKKTQIINILSENIELTDDYLPSRDSIQTYVDESNFDKVAEMILSILGINKPQKD